eukprot:17011-Eustigmatos_ZCMA.PRE.1
MYRPGMLTVRKHGLLYGGTSNAFSTCQPSAILVLTIIYPLWWVEWHAFDRESPSCACQPVKFAGARAYVSTIKRSLDDGHKSEVWLVSPAHTLTEGLCAETLQCPPHARVYMCTKEICFLLHPCFPKP